MTAATPPEPCLLVRPQQVAPFSRGGTVVTLPMVGVWNSEQTSVTTGITVFGVGDAIPLHTHNVEECVLVLDGLARVTIGEDSFDVGPGTVSWVPAGTPHCFTNRGDGPMRIYWVYGGRDVTRTICATGETFAHLSDRDRGAVRAG